MVDPNCGCANENQWPTPEYAVAPVGSGLGKGAVCINPNFGIGAKAIPKMGLSTGLTHNKAEKVRPWGPYSVDRII